MNIKNKIRSKTASIKTKLGFCCYHGCCKRAVAEMQIPVLNVKRGLCPEHLKEFNKKLTGSAILRDVDIEVDE